MYKKMATQLGMVRRLAFNENVRTTDRHISNMVTRTRVDPRTRRINNVVFDEEVTVAEVSNNVIDGRS